MPDGARTGWKHIKKKKSPPAPPNSLPQPLRREGSADKRGMRIDRESTDD